VLTDPQSDLFLNDIVISLLGFDVGTDLGRPKILAPRDAVDLDFAIGKTADPAVEKVSGLTPDLTPDLATQSADPGWD